MRSSTTVGHRLKPGDLVLFDNTRILHGRDCGRRRPSTYRAATWMQMGSIARSLYFHEKGVRLVTTATIESLIDLLNAQGRERILRRARLDSGA